mgnify:CR=1 FL=1
MKKGIVGKKIGMTQIFTEDGRLLPVTVIQAGPCPVVQLKTLENDGYEAAQIAFGAQKASRLAKAQVKHFEKAGVDLKKYLAEFRPEEGENYEETTNYVFSNFSQVNLGNLS